MNAPEEMPEIEVSLMSAFNAGNGWSSAIAGASMQVDMATPPTRDRMRLEVLVIESVPSTVLG
jgi:hypothetical protein